MKSLGNFLEKTTGWVENFGTKIFGKDSEMDKKVDEFNPINLGFHDLMKYMNETVNKKQETKKEPKNNEDY